MLTSTHTLKATLTGIALALRMYAIPSAHAQSAGIGVPPGGSSGSPDLVITGAFLVPIASPSASGASGSSGGSGGSVGGAIPTTQPTPTTELEVRVLNRGNGTAAPSYLRFRSSLVLVKLPVPALQFGIGSTSPGRLPVMGAPVLLHVLTPALQPGMSAFVRVPSGFNVGFFDLYADALGQLQESNEQNNAWRVFLP